MKMMMMMIKATNFWQPKSEKKPQRNRGKNRRICGKFAV